MEWLFIPINWFYNIFQTSFLNVFLLTNTGFFMNYWDKKYGKPYPYGVHWDEELKSYNISIYSKHAKAITLHFYEENDLINPVYDFEFDVNYNKTESIWHGLVAESQLKNAKYYSLQVDGDFDPQNGHRFDKEKDLLDPYAHGVFFPVEYSREAAMHKGSNRGKAPLGKLASSEKMVFDWENDKKPHHQHDLIIYEMHVRGFTRDSSSTVNASNAGTFKGIIDKIPYLKELGITAIELLPIFQFDPQENNYWGYMTLSFFALHQDYCVSNDIYEQIIEFKQMVKALHAADIEVILDVVYNHTTEKGNEGPTFSYKGIDNHTYYLLTPDNNEYRNDAGTGNVLRSANKYTRKMILDSLRFWAAEMHVDGFRFDLAATLTRGEDGKPNLIDPPVIASITSDPVLANVRLIGEVWDVNTYQLGQSFPGLSWMQWNGKYRDDVRHFVKSDNDMIGALIQRLYGSDDLFADNLLQRYKPYQSVNFITAHDGFCLYDLVSYSNKHNEANGENNRDGTNDNISWNSGWEGDENLPASVLSLRKRQIKNFISILMLSNGTPMFVMGDEFMNTQFGNNNPYNQDNITTWLDWGQQSKNADMFEFFKGIIQLRKDNPHIAPGVYWKEQVQWYGPNGNADLSFDSHTIAYCIKALTPEQKDIYVLINAYWENISFNIQEGQAGDWLRLVDTNLGSPADVLSYANGVSIGSDNYLVNARSLVVLQRK